MKHDRGEIKCSVTERKQKAKTVTHPAVVLLPKKITITTLYALKVMLSIVHVLSTASHDFLVVSVALIWETKWLTKECNSI